MHMQLGWPLNPRMKARSSSVACVGPFGTLSTNKCVSEDRTAANQRKSRANRKKEISIPVTTMRRNRDKAMAALRL